MKNKSTIYWAIVIVVFIVAMIIWQKSINKNSPDSISRSGIHWHPELTIYVKGEKQEIPTNIGLVGGHRPIHTHEDLPIIHLEFQGLVRKQDLTLGQFFKSWGKDINSFGTNVTMTVNGQENSELGNYVMQDKDKIELNYD